MGSHEELVWHPPEVLAICHLRNSCRRTNHCVAKVIFGSGTIFTLGLQFSGEWPKLPGGTTVSLVHHKASDIPNCGIGEDECS